MRKYWTEVFKEIWTIYLIPWFTLNPFLYKKTLILRKKSLITHQHKRLEMEVKLLEKSYYLHTSCPKINTCQRNTMRAWNEEQASLHGESVLERK